VRESTLEARCRKRAAALGWRLPKWVSPGNNGVPDRILLADGCLVFIEFKAPGKRPTPLQQHWIDWLNDHGLRAEVIDSYDAFETLVEELSGAGGRADL